MKFKIAFKDPNFLSVSLVESAKHNLREKNLAVPTEEYEILMEDELNRLNAFTKKWIRWGEYLTVEFDDEAGTATVVKVSE